MSISVLQTAAGTGTGTSVSATFTNPSLEGNGIVVCVGYNTGSITSVTDSLGNTYLIAKAVSNAGANLSAIYYCPTSHASAGLVVTVNFASSATPAVAIAEVLGQIAVNTSNSGTANNTSHNPGAITTTVADTVIFGADRASNLPAKPAGFTDISAAAATSDLCYEVVTAIQTALNPTWTTGASVPYACCIAAFTSTIIAAQGQIVTAGPVRFGPPIPGSPWMMTRPYRPPPPTIAPPPPVPDVIRTYARPVYGPPIPGAPWSALFGFPPATAAQTAAPPAVVPADPTGPGHGKDLPLLPSVPRPNDKDFSRRLARHTEMAADRLNALVRTGQFQFLGGSKWRIQAPAFQSAADPTADDDGSTGALVGSMWVNTTTSTGFLCLDNALSAAVWKQVTS